MVDCSNLENDCIAILTYLADNPMLWQTYRGIAKATGIPVTTAYRIIRGFEFYGPNNWALGSYADKYGFDLKYIGYPGRILYIIRKV